MATAIRDAIKRAREMLASKPDAGPSSDRPATAVVEDGLHCRIDGPDDWSMVTDMPGAVGGGGSAPTPGWVLRAGWAACTATAIAMRAAELGIELARLEVTAESESDMRGLLAVGNGISPGPVTARLRVRIEADGAAREELEALVEWADRHSPVGDAIRRAVPVEVVVE